MTKRGRPVRADYHFVRVDRPWRVAWELEVEGSPFDRVLDEAMTEVLLEPTPTGTIVTIAQRQKLKGYSRSGGLLVKRSTRTRLDQALAALEQLVVSQAA
jgi:hypothetical protein